MRLNGWLDGLLDHPLRPDDFAGMDRESCLVLLRYYDRQERFEDGLRASVHGQGLLHALIERLIALEV